jgi:hypothetical protein
MKGGIIMGLIKFGKRYNDEEQSDKLWCTIHPVKSHDDLEEHDGKIHLFRHWFDEEK